MLTLPEQFDVNEWIIIILLLSNIVLFKLPKKFPSVITVLLVLLSISMAKLPDHTIAIRPFDLYDLNDTQKYELFDLLLYGAYPPFGIICIYLYTWFNIKGIFTLLYILIWSMFAVIFEYFLVFLGVFDYKGWTIFYSFPVYLITVFIYILFYNFALGYYDKRIKVQE